MQPKSSVSGMLFCNEIMRESHSNLLGVLEKKNARRVLKDVGSEKQKGSFMLRG